MNIREVIANTPLDGAVQRFAEQHNLLFHRRQWLDCYEDGLMQLAILNNNEEVIGCFLVYRYSKMGLRFMIAPPYTPGIALFVVNPAQTTVSRNSFSKEVGGVVAAWLLSQKTNMVDLQFSEQHMDVQPYIWAGFRAGVRYTYLIDLQMTEEELSSHLSPEKRKSLNKAVKDGVKIESCNDATLAYRLISARLELNGVGKNMAILEKILKQFIGTPLAICRLASINGAPVSVSFSVINNDRAIYVLGGVGENSHHGAGVTCMWESILEARRLGLKVFDFEGSMNPGIERYYREFGGRMTAYPAITRTSRWLSPVMSIFGR